MPRGRVGPTALAVYIWEQKGTEPIESVSGRLIDPGSETARVDQVIAGALKVLQERIAEDPRLRRSLREHMLAHGMIRSRAVEGKESAKTKYTVYYDFRESIAKIPSHRMLAIRRGSREGVLTFSIDVDRSAALRVLTAALVEDPTTPSGSYLQRAVEMAYDRLLESSVRKDVLAVLREQAELDAIRVLEDNLRALLLAPPAGPVALIGIETVSGAECRVAAVGPDGQLLEQKAIQPSASEEGGDGARTILLDLIARHNVGGIAIGNGTACRETEAFVRAVTAERRPRVFTVVVNGAAASVYASSRRARDELPDLDSRARYAMFIARRVQDPLAELVKIHPRSIGVGQYQNDVDQKKMRSRLTDTIQSCVSHVGVDVNAASVDLLKYVSGLSEPLASAIVAHRTQHGPFRSRKDLLGVRGLSGKAFEQSAGFLRVMGGDHPLDRTAIHTESYPVVERMAGSVGVSIEKLVEGPERVAAIDFGTFETEAGRHTVADTRDELLKPGQDPRGRFVAPHFRDDVRQLSDLEKGMVLEGSVTNATNFGAFVDVGVQHDGLIHISELSHRYIQDARRAVTVGDVVKVRVISVDLANQPRQPFAQGSRAPSATGTGIPTEGAEEREEATFPRGRRCAERCKAAPACAPRVPDRKDPDVARKIL